MGIDYCLTVTASAVDTFLMVLGQAPVLEKVTSDATAVISVPAYLFKDLFFVQSDNYDFLDSTGIANPLASSDLTYCCLPNNWPRIAFDRATVIDGKVPSRALPVPGPNDYTSANDITNWGLGNSTATSGQAFNRDVAGFCVGTFLGLGTMDTLKNEQDLVSSVRDLNVPLQENIIELLKLNGGTPDSPRGNTAPQQQTDTFGSDSNNYARQMFISGLESAPAEFLQRLATEAGKWHNADGTPVVPRRNVGNVDNIGPLGDNSPWLNIPIEAGDTVTIYTVIGAGNRLQVQAGKNDIPSIQYFSVPFLPLGARQDSQSKNINFQINRIGEDDQGAVDYIPNVPRLGVDNVPLFNQQLTAFPTGALAASGTEVAPGTFGNTGTLANPGAGKVHAWRVYEMKMTMTDVADPNAPDAGAGAGDIGTHTLDELRLWNEINKLVMIDAIDNIDTSVLADKDSVHIMLHQEADALTAAGEERTPNSMIDLLKPGYVASYMATNGPAPADAEWNNFHTLLGLAYINKLMEQTS